MITCEEPTINKEGIVSNSLKEAYDVVDELIKKKYLEIKDKKIYITEYVVFNGKYIRQDNSHIDCILIDQKY
jgi:hypothetical protein